MLVISVVVELVAIWAALSLVVAVAVVPRHMARGISTRWWGAGWQHPQRFTLEHTNVGVWGTIIYIFAFCIF